MKRQIEQVHESLHWQKLKQSLGHKKFYALFLFASRAFGSGAAEKVVNDLAVDAFMKRWAIRLL